MYRPAGCSGGLAKGAGAAALLLFCCSLYLGACPGEEAGRKEEPVWPLAASSSCAGAQADLYARMFRSGLFSPGLKVDALSPEERTAIVYTFLQGPKAFQEGRPWSGAWCGNVVRGNSFGGFGCGLCCMANIYGTLTNYECSPWDMYEYAVTASAYAPSEESGAIGWDDMKAVLSSLGFECEACVKPATYEEFQEQMKQAESAVVLVSSAYDDAFWKDTPGHYVNIWLYREDTDMVFLAEPGDPDNNRTWIPLRYVYDALKLVSPYQYLSVRSYSEEGNLWKHDGISGEWNGRSL